MQTLSEIAAAVTIPKCSDWWNQRRKYRTTYGNGVAGVSLVSEIMLAEQITEKVQGLMRNGANVGGEKMTEYNLTPQVVTIAGSDSGGELACKQI